jgi:hypothetical protein
MLPSESVEPALLNVTAVPVTPVYGPLASATGETLLPLAGTQNTVDSDAPKLAPDFKVVLQPSDNVYEPLP